jgi:hypothetical protein
MSGHIELARAKKVALIVALVPAGANQAENDALATCLQNFDDSQRARWAEAAGCSRPPSDITWHLSVKAVRARLHRADNTLARGGRAS